MSAKAIVPRGMAALYRDWRMSPGLEHDGFVFLTGVTGVEADGAVSPDPERQIRRIFDQIGEVLAEAGLGFGHLVEMTSYHVGLREHLDLFRAIRAEHVEEPYPAWTAIEVAGFATEGVVVEIRAVARRG